MQVAVEIRVEPKTRADRAIGVRIRRSLSAPDHPPDTARIDGRIDQGVAREAAPNLEVGAEIRFAANDGKEIARATSAQRSNKLGQQAGGERFSASVQLDVRFASHTLSPPEPPPFRLALVHCRPQVHNPKAASIEIKSRLYSMSSSRQTCGELRQGRGQAANRGRKTPARVAAGSHPSPNCVPVVEPGA